MKKKKAPAVETPAYRDFQPGQVWRIGEMNLAVTMVGKLLVHYRQYKTQSRGSGVSLCSKTDFERFLTKGKATLVESKP